MLTNKTSKIERYKLVDFTVEKDGLYAIDITAACKKQQDLRIEIDGQCFREIPAYKYVQKFNIPAAWNGDKLLGLAQTNVFMLNLAAGKHQLEFFSRNRSLTKITQSSQNKLLCQTNRYRSEIIWDCQYLGSTYVSDKHVQVKAAFNFELQSPRRDRQPWVNFILVSLPLKQIKATATVNKHQFSLDHDDVKLVIDNRTRQRSGGRRFRDWLWHATMWQNIDHPVTHQITTNLPRGYHVIEFWADQTPVLNSVVFYFNNWQLQSTQDKKTKQLDQMMREKYPRSQKLDAYVEYYGAKVKPALIIYNHGQQPNVDDYMVFFYNETGHWETVNLYDKSHQSQFLPDNGINIESPQADPKSPLSDGWLAFYIGTTWLSKHGGIFHPEKWHNDGCWVVYKLN